MLTPYWAESLPVNLAACAFAIGSPFLAFFFALSHFGV